MIDFVVNIFSEIGDFFLNFCVDNVIDKIAKRKKSRIYGDDKK